MRQSPRHGEVLRALWSLAHRPPGRDDVSGNGRHRPVRVTGGTGSGRELCVRDGRFRPAPSVCSIVPYLVVRGSLSSGSRVWQLRP